MVLCILAALNDIDLFFLDKIVNNCGIEAYIDEFNMNDARWQQFYCEISSYLHLEDTSENRI